MLSVESSVLHDTPTVYRRTQVRKHLKEGEKGRLIKSKGQSAATIRSPLSYQPSKLSQVWSLTAAAAATLTADVIIFNNSKQSHTSAQGYAPIKHLFVSPHPDDICYSCFSTVSNGQNEEDYIDGERVIVTVFSKSRCANGELGEQLKRNVADISRVRKVEDEAFASMVNCKLYSLDQPDSSARDEYSRWTHLADQDVTEQHRVVKGHLQYPNTVKALSPIIQWAVQCKAAIYMPLGVGCHVDHLLTRVAVTCILDDIKAERGFNKLPIALTYYEDLPYAFYSTEESIQQLARNVLSKSAKSSLIPVDQECWDRKKQAVLTYATQMKPVILPALHERAVTLANLDADSDSGSDSSCEEVGLMERIWTV